MIANRLHTIARSAIVAATLVMALPLDASFTFNDIAVTVALHRDGHAAITEVWDLNFNGGNDSLELFLNRAVRGIQRASEFAVREDDTPFGRVEPWPEKASAAVKTGHYYVREGQDGSEMCWGLGMPGYHRFTITYTLSALVQQRGTDVVMDYTFVYGNMRPRAASVTVMLVNGELTDADILDVQAKPRTVVQERNDGRLKVATTQAMNERENLKLQVTFAPGVFDALQDGAASLTIAPYEMASAMMRDTTPRTYKESWWNALLGLYDAHPVLVLIAAIALVIALSWFIKKVIIALI